MRVAFSKKRFVDDCSLQAITREPRASWATLPASVEKAHNEIHVWRAKASESNAADLADCLTVEEHAHAKRFLHPGNRNEFIVARGFTRFILSRYVSMPPQTLRLRAGQHGKPWLEDLLCGARLTFSLSHSGGLVLLAITLDHELGIDLEVVDSRVDFGEFASLVFSPTEVMSLSQFPAEEWQRAHFQCWTRKEAFVKALGEGLSERVRELEVVASAGRLLPRINGVAVDDHWMIRDLNVDHGFVAAVAVADCNCSFRFWQWPG